MNFFKQIKSRTAFTLMEVNLAILIMAVGVLTMVSLYPLAFRENQHSRDDVRSAATAQHILNQIMGKLSNREITWNQWMSAINSAQSTWADYCDNNGIPKGKSQISSKGRVVFNALMTVGGPNSEQPIFPSSSKLAYALVVNWGRLTNEYGETVKDASRVAISLRVTSRAPELFAQPIYYTEVHFQGLRTDGVSSTRPIGN